MDVPERLLSARTPLDMRDDFPSAVASQLSANVSQGTNEGATVVARASDGDELEIAQAYATDYDDEDGNSMAVSYRTDYD